LWADILSLAVGIWCKFSYSAVAEFSV
jgi:hypothetical protein